MRGSQAYPGHPGTLPGTLPRPSPGHAREGSYRPSRDRPGTRFRHPRDARIRTRDRPYPGIPGMPSGSIRDPRSPLPDPSRTLPGWGQDGVGDGDPEGPDRASDRPRSDLEKLAPEPPPGAPELTPGMASGGVQDGLPGRPSRDGFGARTGSEKKSKKVPSGGSGPSPFSPWHRCENIGHTWPRKKR